MIVALTPSAKHIRRLHCSISNGSNRTGFSSLQYPKNNFPVETGMLLAHTLNSDGAIPRRNLYLCPAVFSFLTDFGHFSTRKQKSLFTTARKLEN